ncbi:zinc-binding alcohol dehydrogenase family protein [Pseudanabaena sp. FACHB-1998]|uniref:quinone oxidoreductase family protein n=1 Tax=Pseudanabaena sp. FACHB-1998 TaxID=2692858 RepID=UPI0016806488|nr:zinc-binding alcohol dehydrogenase family protein [Pseudanabaena sp. FACHB-1998]MBD2179216.1 zinc-binding alcohol dehydrogenase family protein [Pseudanabaena sp. FACHB-1998]
MKTVAICGSQVKTIMSAESFVDSIEIEGIQVNCGVIHTKDITFSPNDPALTNHVLFQVKAFSCNYRDKRIILNTATSAPANRFNAIGSEFVGVVLAVGADVIDLKAGDRVIANNCYPNSGVTGLPPGVPTNHASKELRILHRAKLIKIPDVMPDDVAASFSIGGQTSYSMIRKLQIQPEQNILVTAARSNTSLFVLHALQKYRQQMGIRVYALTSSSKFIDKIQAIGVDRVVPINPNSETWIEPETATSVLEETKGGFHSIIDPFFDLHIARMLPVMKPEAKYITCGLYDQFTDLTGTQSPDIGISPQSLLYTTMIYNLSIIGNCIGLTSDLAQAIADYAQGNLHVAIDSVYTGKDVAPFFDRTYNSPDRFGKVVYSYED